MTTQLKFKKRDIESEIDKMKWIERKKDIPSNNEMIKEKELPIIEKESSKEEIPIDDSMKENNESLESVIDDNAIPNDVTVVDLDMQTVKTVTTLDKAFTELFNEISLEKKTEFLKNDEIKNLGTLYSMAKHYGFIALQERIIKHMQMRISLKREGRKEAVELVKSERQHEEMKNMLDRYSRGNNQT
jgi:hypothetical protein